MSPGQLCSVKVVLSCFDKMPTCSMCSVLAPLLCMIFSLACASCRGVLPLLSRVVRSVPALRSKVTTGTWLVQAARCMAVLPSLSFWLGSAPCLNNTSTTSEYPCKESSSLNKLMLGCAKLRLASHFDLKALNTEFYVNLQKIVKLRSKA